MNWKKTIDNPSLVFASSKKSISVAVDVWSNALTRSTRSTIFTYRTTHQRHLAGGIISDLNAPNLLIGVRHPFHAGALWQTLIKIWWIVLHFFSRSVFRRTFPGVRFVDECRQIESRDTRTSKKFQCHADLGEFTMFYWQWQIVFLFFSSGLRRLLNLLHRCGRNWNANNTRRE